jgi:hypothetical protein
MATDTKTNIAIDANAKACIEKLVVALRAGDTTTLKEFCCVNFGTWSEGSQKAFEALNSQGITNLTATAGTKIEFCANVSAWIALAKNNEAFSSVIGYLTQGADWSQGCACVEETNCCDNSGTYAGIGLMAAIVFERIEMGKKVRGENNKHGIALGLVLGIIVLMIITDIGSSLSGVWLIALAAVVFIGMSIIQGRFMQQYSLNRTARFDDFTSDTNENPIDQSFFSVQDNGFAF